MNTSLLWLIPLILVLAGCGGWLWHTRRSKLGAKPPSAPAARPAQPARMAATPAGLASTPATLSHPPAQAMVAQRLAATEALRQARRRAADETARQTAERQAAAASAPHAAAPSALRTAAPVARFAPPAVAPAATPTAAPPEPSPVVAPTSATAAALGAAAPAAPSPSSDPSGPITVLLVDDSKVVRIKTSRLLEKHHYRVVLADDGLSALQCLADAPPDLVITDVEMPGLDGFGLTQRLRSDPRWQRLPVIMVTSADERHRSAAMAAGVTVLLGKPYEEATLLAEVRAAVGQPVLQGSARLALQ